MPEALGQGLRGLQRWIGDTNHHSSAEGATTTFKQEADIVCKGITSSHILLQILHLTWIRLGKTVCGDPQEPGLFTNQEAF